MTSAFTTEVKLQPIKESTGYNHRWLALGSCFAENIGMRLKNAGFSALINPFGVQFNPFSVSQAIKRIKSNTPIHLNELFMEGTVWNHFSFSNLHSGVNKEDTAERMNKAICEAARFFSSVKMLMITWGTAWVYEDVKSGEIVANCHKLPPANFLRRRVSVREIVEEYAGLLKLLPPDTRVILTVSPVRHWKDGAHENTLSKSILHLACEELMNKFTNISYFPAYEIVVDELRDYRFYTSDMVHPTDLAIEHVWEQFLKFSFTKETIQVVKEIEHYRRMSHHRSIHPDSEQHKAFIGKTESLKAVLLQKYPYITLD